MENEESFASSAQWGKVREYWGGGGLGLSLGIRVGEQSVMND